MVSKSRLYATAALLSFLGLASPTYAQATSSGTTVFPPTNQAAGSGLLYFPAGGDSSLYAVPVVDPALVTAVNNQTLAIQQLTAVVEQMQQNQVGQYQISCSTLPATSGAPGSGPATVSCYTINTTTGAIQESGR